VAIAYIHERSYKAKRNIANHQEEGDSYDEVLSCASSADATRA